MTARARIVAFTLVAAVAGAAIIWFLILPRLQPHTFNGQVLQGIEAPSIQLDGSNGEKVSLADFEGRVVAVYFGYTFCPDVCPTSLAKLDRAREMLGDKKGDVQVVMVTVDPERDTSEALAEYMGRFDESFLGLTGDPNDIDRIATVYGIYYEAQESTSAAGYLVDHTATVMIIDKNGELKLIMPYDMTDVQVAEDLEFLVG